MTRSYPSQLIPATNSLNNSDQQIESGTGSLSIYITTVCSTFCTCISTIYDTSKSLTFVLFTLFTILRFRP